MSEFPHYRYYAPPIVRDSFSCSGGDLYVTIEGHRHERTDPESLHRLLTYTQPAPLLTKAGKVAKRQPAPHKDPPGHFYCAQLLHYGLKPMKTREAAKKQLSATFVANGTLSVPERILKLEETLQKEYRHANEIAKKKYEEDEKIREMEEETQRKRRKEIMMPSCRNLSMPETCSWRTRLASRNSNHHLPRMRSPKHNYVTLSLLSQKNPCAKFWLG
jgi:hypothetical protein